MKIPLLLTALALSAQAPAPAESDASVNVLLAGGQEPNMISIGLSPDGRSYVIDSIATLEVGGSVCANPPDVPNRLTCEASAVASFEINAGSGDDRTSISRTVTIPVTVRAGSGNDYVSTGGGPDKLFGGDGYDRLFGRAGDDLIYGGPRPDNLFGGSGNDMLRGGPGPDYLAPGSGINSARQ